MIRLHCPYDNGAYLSLPNPEIGNVHQLNIKTIFKQNMAGQISSHIGTQPLYKMPINFVTLTVSEKESLRIFYNQAVGKEVKYVDYQSYTWRCILVNDSLVITTIKDDCSYDCSIELTGTLVST